MKINLFLSFITICLSLALTNLQAQEINTLDQDYLDSLPDDVRDDVIKEMENTQMDKDKNVQKRPSSALSKNEVVREWENFKKRSILSESTERYGLKLFGTMQSSFMPLNEPNFGNNYVVDYGDWITIYINANGENEVYEAEIERDGTILIPDVGKISLAGLNFEQVTDLIKMKYQASFIGAEVFVVLSEIRDINILITGSVEYPGVYTLSGNSNILQALNIVGGVKENGSLRNIILKRKGEKDEIIDLYDILIYGNIEAVPFLMSGDSIHIEPVKNLVRAGYGFNNIGTYELKEKETIEDLIKFASGLKPEAQKNNLKLVRLVNSSFVTYDLNLEDASDYEINNLDSVYAYEEKIGTVTVSGGVQYPGKYSISSSDRLLDVIERSGGYIDSAYPFGGSLLRVSAKNLEKEFASRAYQNLISYIAANPANLVGGEAGSLTYILSELKNYEPSGRFIAEFDLDNLKDNMQNNIYLNNGDKIHIPTYTSNVFVFGEVGNPGTVVFKDDISLNGYINKSGGFTRLASSDYIFIVSPNGETLKVQTNGIRRIINQDYEIYPGSVIYIPRHIGKVDGLNLYATLAPIFSSLALSVASLNSISD